LLLFKGFNEKFKIKDPTLEIIHSGQTAVLLGFTCTSITKASSSSRVSDTLKAFKSEHIGDIIFMAIVYGGKSPLSSWVWLVLTTIVFSKPNSTLKIVEPYKL